MHKIWPSYCILSPPVPLPFPSHSTHAAKPPSRPLRYDKTFCSVTVPHMPQGFCKVYDYIFATLECLGNAWGMPAASEMGFSALVPHAFRIGTATVSQPFPSCMYLCGTCGICGAQGERMRNTWGMPGERHCSQWETLAASIDAGCRLRYEYAEQWTFIYSK